MVFWKKKFFYFLVFLVKMQKNNVFEDKWRLSKMLSQIKMQAATNWSSHLKKHQVFDFFSNDIKKLRFLRFLKIICSTRKNHCMRLILCKH